MLPAFPENWGARLRISGGCPARGEPVALKIFAQASRAGRSPASDAPQFSKCNGDDRSQRLKQGGAVGAAASKTRAPTKARSGCWEPQPEGAFPTALPRQSRFFAARYPGELGGTTAHLRRLPRKGRAGGAYKSLLKHRVQGAALPAMHPSSPSADYISDASLRLCFGRAVFCCKRLKISSASLWI